MNSEFKREVMDCMEEFAFTVRMTRLYEDAELDRLKGLLSELADVLQHETVIDKDLVGSLYTLPQVVRNMFLSYDGPPTVRLEQFARLEDAWVDLDALVLDCLHRPAT
ncbi:hypothetical protein F2P45_20005 [Massilia sp. CCM 8733]|uniref:Uncharacterized protein n=1 Tax=Massilia mucilaginosa TaxID=2609282 RepID=A0ABX0NX45_9BURK|nr:hypothetical protein [Massilia mucilaginosa]NHZ91280.1 hypothetical protein [Massilia mucilaginosa]